MRCVAIIMSRNGMPYVERCIEHLTLQGIEVALIDHDSNDGSYELAESYLGSGVCSLTRVKFEGSFSLAKQLKLKQLLIDSVATDWVMHLDIDELPDCPDPARTLLNSFEDVGRQGYNAVNFDEFVFIPYEEAGNNFYESQLYYHFSPFKPRLMRAWEKKSNLSALTTGGHVLKGDVRLFPQNYILRHYIFTSQQHAFEKYGDRTFDNSELAKGWHRNRVNISRDKLLFPDKSDLKSIADVKSKQYDCSDPWKKHFWER